MRISPMVVQTVIIKAKVGPGRARRIADQIIQIARDRAVDAPIAGVR